jgi:hypothetical protein
MATTARSDLTTPVRNHYYYGKLLDVNHFELETNYGNAKRWLLNRLVLGYGVICGLGVRFAKDEPWSLQVARGAAIDHCGQEIIVPQEWSNAVPIPASLVPPAPSAGAPGASPPVAGVPPPSAPIPNPSYLDSHVVLCYHECQSSPEPVLAGSCASTGPCLPGEIREQYRIEICAGAAPPFSAKCQAIQNAFSNGQINYQALANYVTNRTVELPRHCGIVLANLHIPVVPDPRACRDDWIDISVRRIVYSNDLLFDLLLSLAGAASSQAGK